MLKKILFTSLGIIFSNTVLAGEMGPSCMPGNVTVPCPAQGWDLGVQALYLKPVFSQERAYGLSNGAFREIDYGWNWGYLIEGSYHFNTGNDITVDWTHLDANEDFSLFSSPTDFFTTTTYTLGTTTQFDQINLTFGQHVDVGALKNIHFFAGLQYASIISDLTSTFNLTPEFIDITEISGVRIYNKSQFQGGGPVLGLDYQYDFNSGLSITASSSASILYGSTQQRVGTIFAPTGLIPISAYANKQNIVPGVEAKLGLNYAYRFAQGTLNILGGYQVLEYFNALPNVIVGSNDSDFGLYGPYFGINWLGDL